MKMITDNTAFDALNDLDEDQTCIIIGLAAEGLVDVDVDVDAAETVNLRPARMRLAKGTTPAVNDAADTLAMTLAIGDGDGS